MSEFKSFLFSTPCLDKVKLQDDAANDECMGKMSLLSNLYESLVCTDGKKYWSHIELLKTMVKVQTGREYSSSIFCCIKQSPELFMPA